MERLMTICILAFCLNGCATTTGWFNREIQENEIAVGDESRSIGALQASVLGMSENRRGILIRDNRRLENGTPRLYFCAEPPPDVAMSSKASFAAGVTLAGKGDAKAVDEYSRIAMQLANRTTLLDVYRTAVFSLCQMHMNGAITHVGAERMFEEFTKMAIAKAPSSETPNTGKPSGATFGPTPSIDTADEKK
jgi:hypothetical protein